MNSRTSFLILPQSPTAINRLLPNPLPTSGSGRLRGPRIEKPPHSPGVLEEPTARRHSDISGSEPQIQRGRARPHGLAIAAVAAGLEGPIGPGGIGVAASLMIFVGNPWSGVGSAPELLPEPAGLIGQLLPPGAGGNLLRSTAFFDGAHAGPRGATRLVRARARGHLRRDAARPAERRRPPSSLRSQPETNSMVTIPRLSTDT